MDLTGTTHISNSYIPNSRPEPVFASGQRRESFRVPNVQEGNIGASSVAQRVQSICLQV